ncbi:subtilisin family serine protease, partial [Rhodoligotrophos appendicifer]
LRGQSLEIIKLSHSDSASSTDHGTAIAALLIGRGGGPSPGLLPNAKLVAVDAFRRQPGIDDHADVVGLISALEALVERRVGVINMSFSGPPNPALQSAIKEAAARGVIFVAAAGNGGPGARASYPAAYNEVIAVTAIDPSFNVYPFATTGSYVDLAAPGVNIWTAQASLEEQTRSGTSYAAPFVTAAAALLAAGQRFDSASIPVKLKTRAQDLGKAGRDDIFGFGLLQMAGLCDELIASTDQGLTPSSVRITAAGD